MLLLVPGALASGLDPLPGDPDPFARALGFIRTEGLEPPCLPASAPASVFARPPRSFLQLPCRPPPPRSSRAPASLSFFLQPACQPRSSALRSVARPLRSCSRRASRPRDPMSPRAPDDPRCSRRASRSARSDRRPCPDLCSLRASRARGHHPRAPPPPATPGDNSRGVPAPHAPRRGKWHGACKNAGNMPDVDLRKCRAKGKGDCPFQTHI